MIAPFRDGWNKSGEGNRLRNPRVICEGEHLSNHGSKPIDSGGPVQPACSVYDDHGTSIPASEQRMVLGCGDREEQV